MEKSNASDLYFKNGVGYVKTQGRYFKLEGLFAERDTRMVNNYLETAPNLGVILVSNGWVYIADKDDEGTTAL